jgi:hypothetical protein
MMGNDDRLRAPRVNVLYFRLLLAAIGIAALGVGSVEVAADNHPAPSSGWAIFAASAAIGALTAGVVGVVLARRRQPSGAGAAPSRIAAWRLSSGVALGGLGALIARQLGDATSSLLGCCGMFLLVVASAWPSTMLGGAGTRDAR